MKTLWKSMIPILIVAIGAGCASSGKQTPLETFQKQQTARINEILEQVDRNSATVRENNSEIAGINERLTALENKVNTALTNNNATTQEIKENLAFMNDQILRLDSSIRTKRPAPRPEAASVFKPGGFDVKASYNGALDEYYARRYESALNSFTELLTVAPTHTLADNAQYWIGECYYGMGNYQKALEAFLKVFDFPKSNKLADAHLKVGLTYVRMGNTDSAKEELKAVIQNYPGTDAATIAAQQLKKLGE